MAIPFVDIAIIGSGPGGLALAQGLRKNGIETAVFERDPVRADHVQGFRLRIRQRAIDALEANLPPHLFEAFLATVGKSPPDSVALDENFNRIAHPGWGSEPMVTKRCELLSPPWQTTSAPAAHSRASLPNESPP
jgi:threonine dehydrogenase-like Zn-dependent dehydrogenase